MRRGKGTRRRRGGHTASPVTAHPKAKLPKAVSAREVFVAANPNIAKDYFALAAEEGVPKPKQIGAFNRHVKEQMQSLDDGQRKGLQAQADAQTVARREEHLQRMASAP